MIFIFLNSILFLSNYYLSNQKFLFFHYFNLRLFSLQILLHSYFTINIMRSSYILLLNCLLISTHLHLHYIIHMIMLPQNFLKFLLLLIFQNLLLRLTFLLFYVSLELVQLNLHFLYLIYNTGLKTKFNHHHLNLLLIK